MSSSSLRFAAAAFAAAACVSLASACSSNSGAGTPKPTVTTAARSTTPTTSTNVVPTPFEINQRFGAGDRWQITTTAAKRSGTSFTVTLDVLNTGPAAATFDASKTGLFTMLDEYADDAPEHEASGLSSVEIPGGTSKPVVVRFDGVSTKATHPILWFHGHLLPGSIDASVWFTGI